WGLSLWGLVVGLAVLPAAAATVSIGYLELEGDARYDPRTAYTRIPLRSYDRPRAGAEVALEEARALAPAIGVTFSLVAASGADVEALVTQVGRWRAEGTRVVLLDLPADALAAVAQRTRDAGVLLLNVSAPEDRLRR